MRLLLILLSMMTFTVQDKRTVTADGTWPYEMSASYSCSYQKGDVRAGDTATLTLTGLNGIELEEVAIYLKSNKNSGAGTISITADGTVIGQEEGTYADWFGAYNNTDFQPISWTGTQKADALQVQITGSANSLHIEKYDIRYVDTDTYTVTLMNGNEVCQTLKEQSGGSGIVLPALSDREEWRFAGWSETEFWEISFLPQIHAPNTTFRPSNDCRLWAVYKKDMGADQGFVTTLSDGIYLYVNDTIKIALTGVPEQGRMNFGNANPKDANQYYLFEFVDTTVYVTHVISGTPIGYEGKQLAAKATPWNVYHNGVETILYTDIGGKHYVFWLNRMETISDEYSSECISYAGLLQTDNLTSTMRLLPAETEEREVYYTCHPEAQGIEMPRGEAGGEERVLMHVGNYELVIKNGEKQLRLR